MTFFFFFLGLILFILDLSGNAEITEFLTGAGQVALWYSRFPAFHSFSIWSEVHQGQLKQILQPCCLWRAHRSPALYRWLRGLRFLSSPAPSTADCHAGSIAINLENWLLSKPSNSLLRLYHLWKLILLFMSGRC